MTAPYRSLGPAIPARPVLLSSPHSGTHLPERFRAQTSLSRLELLQFGDAHVDALLAGACARGLPLLSASHARAVCDLNRSEAELDRSLFDGPLDLPVLLTDSVRAGYGVIPARIAPDRAIYRAPLPAAEARRRIEALHRPWHAALGRRLAALAEVHGAAVLVDCHSMPSLAGTALGPAPQIVLGDLFGRSAAAPLVDLLHQLLAARGLRVARNQPYAGGHVTRRHANPAKGIHVIQVEIDRALYMDQETLEPAPGFAAIRGLLAEVLLAFADAAAGLLPQLKAGCASLPLAAE